MADDEINLLIEECFFGKKILTQEEMRAEARQVWKTQPRCRVFLGGFSYYSPTDTFRQHARPFMTQVDSAWLLVEKLAAGYHPQFRRWFNCHAWVIRRWFNCHAWVIASMTATEVSRHICLFALKEVEGIS